MHQLICLKFQQTVKMKLSKKKPAMLNYVAFGQIEHKTRKYFGTYQNTENSIAKR